MKTQLLEDIGQSATLSLVPSGRVSNLPARAAMPRSATGVWRQKPAAADDDEQAPPQPAPQGPVFDFTPPFPSTAPDVFKREPGWFERPGRRYLTWGACLLASALAVQAAWWFYEEREDAGTLALVADELKSEPQFDKALKRRALEAKEFTLGSDGDVHVEPAAPVPPLVLLEPEPEPEPEPTPVAQQAPVRKIVRKPAVPAETKPDQESAISATLKACREHGYSADQCVKRACSVTKYGFVCRGK